MLVFVISTLSLLMSTPSHATGSVAIVDARRRPRKTYSTRRPKTDARVLSLTLMVPLGATWKS